MSDMKTFDMSFEKRIEQNLFDDFILENKQLNQLQVLGYVLSTHFPIHLFNKKNLN